MKSQEKRLDLPLVSVVLVIDRFGLPMDFEVFAAKYKINQAIVVADKGLNSGSNLKMLEENHLGYLMSQKYRTLASS